MTTTTHTAYTQSIATALTTELNSLAHQTSATTGNSAVSSAIDNTSNLDMFIDVELVLGSQTARSAGGTVIIYISRTLDGSNYDDAEPTCSDVLTIFPLDATTTARRLIRCDLPISPGLFKLWVRNNSSQAFNASGNTLKYRTHSVKSV